MCVHQHKRTGAVTVTGARGSLQAQVYENYNKFIAATDIIRAMKSNVDGMDTTMVDLKQKIGALSAGA